MYDSNFYFPPEDGGRFCVGNIVSVIKLDLGPYPNVIEIYYSV